MKNLTLLLITIFSLLILACGLERSNPLDPESSNINTPKLVRNINLTSSGQGAINKFITITWDALSNEEANGYYVYRSRSYEGTYDLIKEIRDSQQSSYIDYEKIVPGPYFYKMSAFLYLNPASPNTSQRLEGPLNRPGIAGINVPQ